MTDRHGCDRRRSASPQTPEAPVRSRRKTTFVLLVLALAAQLLVVSSGSATARRAPANHALPRLKGQTLVGKTLAATRGRWSNAPTRFGFTWLVCNRAGKRCARIKGASKTTY